MIGLRGLGWLGALGALLTAGAAAAQAPPRAETPLGVAEGLRVGAVSEFLGLPYALPPEPTWMLKPQSTAAMTLSRPTRWA